MKTERARCSSGPNCPNRPGASMVIGGAGTWESWEAWSGCFGSCDEGTRFRGRKCRGHSTAACEGRYAEYSSCDLPPC